MDCEQKQCGEVRATGVWLAIIAIAWTPVLRVPGARGQTTSAPRVTTQGEEHVVWARRVTQAAGAAGANVTARDAQEAVAQDIGELLRGSVPGIAGQRLGATHLDPVLRGARGERVRGTIDGAQVHGACPNRMDPETSLLDIAQVEAVEVVKGPYAVTQGPAGIGGNIAIHSVDPEPSPTFTARGTVSTAYNGNQDGWTVQAAALAGSPRGAVRLAGGLRDFGDYTSGGGEEVAARLENRSLGGTAVWQPDAGRLRLDAKVDSVRAARFASANMDTVRQDAYLGTVRYSRQHPFSAVEEIDANAYYHQVDHEMDNARKPTASMMRMRAALGSRTIGGGLRSSVMTGRATAVLGVDAYDVRHDGRRSMAPRTGPMAGAVMTASVWPETHIFNGGMFAEATVAMTARWRAVLASRIDLVEARARPDEGARTALVRYYGGGGNRTTAREMNVSANARLVYAAGERGDLFFGIGRAVRTASATERFYVFGPGRGGYLVGNPALDPERTLAVDVGAEGEWHGVRFNASMFCNRINEYIAPVLLAHGDVNGDGRADFVRGFRNSGAALVGFDGGGAYLISDQVRLLGSIAYVYGRNETGGDPLPEIPPLEARLGVRVERSWNGGLFTWLMPRLRLVDRQDRVDSKFGEDSSPGFVTMDVLGGLRVSDRWMVSLSVTNLLDCNYHEHLTRENPFTGAEVPEPGRMVSLALRLTL